jgi:hypothetical protein
LAGEIEQHGLDAGVYEVRCDLRAHDAGAQHGDAAEAVRFLRHEVFPIR